MAVICIKCTWSTFWVSVSKPFVGIDFDKNLIAGKHVFLQLLHFNSIFLGFQSKNEGWHLVRMYLSNVIISAVLLNKFTNFKYYESFKVGN